MRKGKLQATARRAVLLLGDQAASLFSLSSGDCTRDSGSGCLGSGVSGGSEPALAPVALHGTHGHRPVPADVAMFFLLGLGVLYHLYLDSSAGSFSL